MHLGGPEPRPVEGELDFAVVRPFLQGAGIGDDRLVVVALALGALSVAQDARGRAGGGRRQRQREHGPQRAAEQA